MTPDVDNREFVNGWTRQTKCPCNVWIATHFNYHRLLFTYFNGARVTGSLWSATCPTK